MYAVLYGEAASVRLLLDKGADPNTRNDEGAKALMWASDNLEKTRLLLDRGSDVNARSDDGRTALMVAAGQFGTTGVVKLLLDRGAKVSPKAHTLFREENALTGAAFTGNAAAIRMLIEHGAGVKDAGPAPLAFAMRAGCQACVEMLLKEPEPSLVVKP